MGGREQAVMLHSAYRPHVAYGDTVTGYYNKILSSNFAYFCSMWFETLMGFKETSYKYVQDNIDVQGNRLISKVNNEEYIFGELEIPTLEKLRNEIALRKDDSSRITLSEVVSDVQELHCNSSNSNAVFQCASQFNLLEMVSPRVTPEYGVSDYQLDKTQGPACAIACGAGTIYRNYFAEVNRGIGQTADNQIDCLDEIGKLLNNEELLLWEMQNGYAMVNINGLLHINKLLHSCTMEKYEQIFDSLKVGIQWNTEVTLYGSKKLVTQVYCSALPIGYSQTEWIYWEALGRLILEATYEATFYVALKNMRNTGSNKLFLTLVGGGVFCNPIDWILGAIEKSVNKFRSIPLDVRIVSYGSSNNEVQKLISKLK